jgi:hypothetical protein
VAASAFAQASRTWVSGVGDDANPCSRTAPCKTFAGAISKTAAGGEINVIDPGGFGGVTITKAITIDGGGTFASILGSGINGVIINAGANDVVVLRNLSINGARQTVSAGINGVRILAAKAVHIENCAIFGFNSRGVSIEPSNGEIDVMLRDTVVRNNGEGIGSFPTSTGSVYLSLNRVAVDQNLGHGVDINAATAGSINDSTLNQNGASGLLLWASTSAISLDHVQVNGNAYGIYAGYLGGAPTIRMGRSTITGNATQGIYLNGGTVIGFQSNVVAGNGGNNNVSSSVVQQ